MTREPLASIWARRAVSIPAYFVLFLAAVALIPLWAPLMAVVDIVSRDTRLPRTRACAFLFWYLSCESLGTLVAALLIVTRFGGPKRFVEANAAFQRAWCGVLFGGALRLYGAKLSVTGAELARPAPLLLFVRHSSSADTVLAAHVVANPNRILLKYVLKSALLWDPCIDIVGRRLPNAFVRRTQGSRDEDVTAVASLGKNLDEHTGVLIYPEGTRFSPVKLAKAVASLKAQGLDELASIASGYQRVLPPRLGGVLALLDAAPGVDVVFLDHEGFEETASFGAFWRGALIGRTLRVRLRRFRAADIPREHRDRWLFEQWVETDRWACGDPPLERAA